MKPNERIKEIRIRKGYSQEYLAQHSGMSRAQYASIEQGRKRLYAHELASISKALGTTADFILFGYEIEKMYGYLVKSIFVCKFLQGCVRSCRFQKCSLL